MDKELTIKVPKDCVIDKERTDLDAGIIVYKKKDPVPWDYNGQDMKGYYIQGDEVRTQKRYTAYSGNHDVFARKAQAYAALAAAQISQYMANDKRYGGVITDAEWKNSQITKYYIGRWATDVAFMQALLDFHFLAFHLESQARLFYKDHKDLVEAFLMLS